MNLDILIERAERQAHVATTQDIEFQVALYQAKALENIAESLRLISITLERLPFPSREER